MSPTHRVHRVGPHAAGDPAAPRAVEQVARIVAAAARHDGVDPLDEAAVLTLRHEGLADGTLWLAGAVEAGVPDGFAWVRGEDLDLVVAPPARGRGVATALARAVTDALPDAALAAWSHGNHPAAARLARRLGWERVRDLWVMRRPLSDLPPLDEALERARSAGVAVRPFRPGADDAAFLAVNAAAFAGHPEQGALTQADLDRRAAEPWFDPAGFFVAERMGPGGMDERPAGGAPEGEPVRAGGLLGFHWTKVHDADPPVGEVYVVGVSPEAQGTGLGRLLTLAGLHHLAARGLPEVLLYVEAGNAAAVATYSGLGFSHAAEDTHVRYARRRTAHSTISAARP